MKNKTKSNLILLVFLSFIFVMGILYAVLPKNDFSSTEKRFLADFPKFSFESLVSGEFTSKFEEYLSDHTPFRNFFVSVNSYYELAKGNNGSNDVYLGSDGWLIEKPVARENRLDTNIKRIVTFSKSVEIPTALMVVPEKGYIYNDKLPINPMAYYDEEYIERMSDRCGKNVEFIDISERMKELKSEKQLYYKTDHHWTSDGAYVGYCGVCDALGTKPTAESEFDAEVTNGFFGTSYATSLYTMTQPDSIKVMRSKHNRGKAKVTIEDGETTHSDDMFFPKALSESDKYVVFLDGNHPYVDIKTSADEGKILIIKDSFAHCLVPFLADNYSEIVMVDLRYYKKPVSQLVKSEKFDRILFIYSMDTITQSRDIILK